MRTEPRFLEEFLELLLQDVVTGHNLPDKRVTDMVQVLGHDVDIQFSGCRDLADAISMLL